MKKYKNYFILAGITLLLCLCCFLPNLISQIPLTYGTDLKPQQYFFIKEIYRLYDQFFQNGTLPFYSWNLFLGTNFFAGMSFYGNMDIFNILGYFLKEMNFFDLEMLLTCLKMFVASFTMYAFLSKFKFDPKIRMLGSICFAFSSWAIFFSGQLMFFSFYCLMPLYFLGMESYLREKKFILFCFSIILLIFTNWYFFYTISFFSPIYFIYRYYLIHGTLKGLLKNASILVIFYLLSVGITMFYFLPTILYLSGNNRVGGLTGLLFFDEIQTYLHQLASMFAPNYMYLYSNNIFETKWHVTREICMWAGSLTSLCVFISFTNKDKKEKFANIILYSILLLILIFPNGNAMMHGFSESSFRWTMLISFINILTMCNVLSKITNFNKQTIKKIALILAIYCLCIVPLTILVLGKNMINYLPQILLFASSSLLILIYGFIIVKKESFVKLCLILTVIELGLFNTMLYALKMDRTSIGTYEFNDSVMHVLQDSEGELKSYLNELEESNYYEYYRVYIPNETICWNYSSNCPVEYGVNGLSTYMSTTSPVLNKLIQIDPSITAKYRSSLILNIESKEMINFLNTKYAFVFDEADLPSGVNWQIIVPNYRGSIKIYKNLDYRPLATSYSSVKKYDELQSLDELLTTVFVETDEEVTEISQFVNNASSSIGKLTYEANQVISTLSSEQGGFMVLTLPYDKGWKILINGQEVKTYVVNGGFIGFNIPAGESSLEMYFTPNGFKTGAILSIVSTLVLSSIAIVLTIRKKKKLS